MSIFDKKTGTNKTNVSQTEKPYDDFRLKVFLKEMKENRTDSVTNMVVEELVMRARFVSPVVFSERPENNNDGTATFKEDAEMRIPMLQASDGKYFYAMFTNNEEYKEWADVQNMDTVILTFDDYAALMDKNPEVAGAVVNPFSENLILVRETIENFKTRKDLLTKGVARHKVNKDTQVMIGDPKEYPEELVEALKRFLPSLGEVRRVWLRLMMKNNVPSLLLVVDHTGQREVIFTKMAEVAKPYLKKTYVDMVDYDTDFGKKAVEKTEPFYSK